MNGSESLSIKDKVDLLKHMELIQRAEVRSRHEREHSVFNWSSNILLVLIGALLIVKPSEGAVWLAYGLWGKAIASIAVLALVWFSIQWQNRNRKWQRENGAVIQRIDRLLHYYDKGFFDPTGENAILPEHWWADHYPTDTLTLAKRLTSTTFPAATAILGFLAVVMIWVS
jgi:small-conductance mechanosensitive channel